MNAKRQFSPLDQVCIGFDQALKSVFGHAKTTSRSYPAAHIPEPNLTETQRKHTAGLMRVNHTGEVCAQALYHGQGLVSKRADVRQKMQQAVIEEGDHLAWCSQRITELGSHKSYLNPFFYLGSLTIGLTAGLIGDEWSLGFLAETEHQVVKHLANHMDLLPTEDNKSQRILQKMQEDEAQHRDDALTAGAKNLPMFIKKLMSLTSKLMVKTAYYI